MVQTNKNKTATRTDEIYNNKNILKRYEQIGAKTPHMRKKRVCIFVWMYKCNEFPIFEVFGALLQVKSVSLIIFFFMNL
jgi:hypothetical protein